MPTRNLIDEVMADDFRLCRAADVQSESTQVRFLKEGSAREGHANHAKRAAEAGDATGAADDSNPDGTTDR